MHKTKTFLRSCYYVPREIGIIILVAIWIVLESICVKITGKQTDLTNPSQMDLDEHELKTYHQ